LRDGSLATAVCPGTRWRLSINAFLHKQQDERREDLAAAFGHFGGVPRTVLGDRAGGYW
jgi:hypothetical protein